MKKLVDSFGRSHNYLRMSLTEKCNLRCKYCMPLEGVSLTPSNELLSLEERKKLISIFASLGVNKIRFTGGEPTLSTHLVPLIKYAHSCGIEAIGITTNGIELGRNPQRFEELVDSGLTSINISLDTLNPSVFERVVRRKASLFDFVQRCITHSLAFEALKVKLNVVMMKGINDKEFPTFVALTKENNLDCRFIELMPFDGNDWTLSQMMTFQEALVGLQSSFISNTSSNGMISHPMCHDYQLFPINYDQSDIHDTTKWYRMISEKSGASFLGRVGFISSMTRLVSSRHIHFSFTL